MLLYLENTLKLVEIYLIIAVYVDLFQNLIYLLVTYIFSKLRKCLLYISSRYLPIPISIKLFEYSIELFFR